MHTKSVVKMEKSEVLIVYFLLSVSVFRLFILNAGSENFVQFSPLQRIINDAKENSTIYVPPGTYYGVTKINKTLTLIGDNVILDANGWDVAVIVSAPNVTLESFTVVNTTRLGYGYPTSELSELWISIEMDGCGVYIYMVDNTTISNVVITQCYAGIGITHIPHETTLLTNVTISYTTWGVMVSRAFAEIVNCNISYNGNLNMSGETNSGGAMWVWCYTCVRVTYSTFQANLWGIIVSDISGVNEVHYNNFINNTHHTSFVEGARAVYNNFDYNYWSDYSGIDTNADGIGDEPYVLDKGMRDNYPLMIDPQIDGTPQCLMGDGVSYLTMRGK